MLDFFYAVQIITCKSIHTGYNPMSEAELTKFMTEFFALPDADQRKVIAHIMRER